MKEIQQNLSVHTTRMTSTVLCWEILAFQSQCLAHLRHTRSICLFSEKWDDFEAQTFEHEHHWPVATWEIPSGPVWPTHHSQPTNIVLKNFAICSSIFIGSTSLYYISLLYGLWNLGWPKPTCLCLFTIFLHHPEMLKKWPSRGRWYAPTCDFWLYC